MQGVRHSSRYSLSVVPSGALPLVSPLLPAGIENTMTHSSTPPTEPLPSTRGRKQRILSGLQPLSGECQSRAVYARNLARSLRRLRVGAQAPSPAAGSLHGWRRWRFRLAAYFIKMRGATPWNRHFSFMEVVWSCVGALVAMFALALVNINVWGRDEQGLLIGSMGASVMLIFGAPASPFAQPRNVVGGHIVSALVGVFVQQHLGFEPWMAAAFAVSFAIVAMHLTATLHPPGGATALIAVIGSPELKTFGYEYALYPVGISALVLVLVGVLVNNLSRRRRYPLHWW